MRFSGPKKNGHGGARANSGGRRPGAGRKPGAVTVNTRDIADRLINNGDTPLEIMVKIMHDHFYAGRFDEAAAVARDCAPYVHAKLATVQHSARDDAALHPAPSFRFELVSPSGAVIDLGGDI